MADASAYQGSQAFSQGSVTNELVTPNTGSLNLSKAIVSLRGINGGIGLTINLSYSAGSQGLLGLPSGWGFGIAYLIPGSSLTTQGKTSIIDLNWTDESGYQSGLRYVNNHGMKFQDIIPPQPLPSGRPGTYSYQLRYTDGSNDYYDSTGKLVEHDDLFGNAITYYYTDQFAGPLKNRLDYIIDSFGQTVQFQYGPNSILVTTPDGAQTTINWSSQGVQNIVDPVGSVTSFTYQTASGQNVVSSVQYPTGLTTQLQYVAISYLDASGNQRSFAAVSDLYHLDAAGNASVDHAGVDESRDEVRGLLRRGALGVDGGAGGVLGEAREQPRPSYQRAGLLARLGHAAADHLLDLGRVQPGALEQRAVRRGERLLRVQPGEVTAPPADRGADGGDDDRSAHEGPLPGGGQATPQSRTRSRSATR